LQSRGIGVAAVVAGMLKLAVAAAHIAGVLELAVAAAAAAAALCHHRVQL
jgi:hypothetical protein